MSVEHADKLQDRIEAESRWPPPEEQRIHELLADWAAIYDSDTDALREVTGWPDGRTYVPDPLAQKATDAQTNLIYGEDPEITAADESDQANVEALVDANDLPTELQHARSLCGAEGEVWWRVLVNRQASDFAIVDWHSRRLVYPLYAGRRLLACAFISELERADGAVWRYVEIHSDEIQRNLLYEGADGGASGNAPVVGTGGGGIGARRDLNVQTETEDLDDEWLHGLPMLAGRIVNRRGRDPSLGVSDYQPVRELLLALNEAQTIGAENARLTLKRRVVVPAASATPALVGSDAEVAGTRPFGVGATVDVSEEVLLANPDDEMDSSDLFKVLEYSFDAQALIDYKGDLTDTILTRMSVAPQLVGRHTEQAQSGAALRARLLDSILAALGKARAWDGAVPQILSLATRVESLPEARGGLGRAWTAPGDQPAVERKSALPEDATEEAARHVALVGAQIEAAETAIRELHEDWDDQRVQDELDKIAKAQSQVFGQGANGTVRVDRPPITLGGGP